MTKLFSKLAGGVAFAALMTGAALADPAVIYDLGGKFDKSFNEAAYNGAEAWKKETGGTYRRPRAAERRPARAGPAPLRQRRAPIRS